MIGLEIENWIEKRGWTVRKFRSTRPRTESNFRFGLTSCRSQNLPAEVRSLLCQVFDSFSLVTLSSSHHASHLRGFIRSLTRPNWSFHSTRLTMSFFYFGRRFSAGTWSSSVGPRHVKTRLRSILVKIQIVPFFDYWTCPEPTGKISWRYLLKWWWYSTLKYARYIDSAAMKWWQMILQIGSSTMNRPTQFSKKTLLQLYNL